MVMRNADQLTERQYKNFMVNLDYEKMNDVINGVAYTLHLKIKKLSTNSSGDFDSVLDTINHYWIDPAK